MIEGRNSKTGDGVLFKDLMSSSSVEPRYYRDTTSSATSTTRTTLLFTSGSARWLRGRGREAGTEDSCSCHATNSGSMHRLKAVVGREAVTHTQYGLAGAQWLGDQTEMTDCQE